MHLPLPKIMTIEEKGKYSFLLMGWNLFKFGLEEETTVSFL